MPIPVKFTPEPENEVAVTTPVNIPSPLTVKADETVVVPIPKLVLVLIPVSLDINNPVPTLYAIHLDAPAFHTNESLSLGEGTSTSIRSSSDTAPVVEPVAIPTHPDTGSLYNSNLLLIGLNIIAPLAIPALVSAVLCVVLTYGGT